VTARVRIGCGHERADVDRRCGAARQARDAHEAASARGRDLRRRLTAARHAVEEAAGAADPQLRQERKERARVAHKAEAATAQDDAGRAEAAARWARTVDAINREARIAFRALGQATRVVNALEAELRTAEASERSLRVSADAAEAACLEARVRLATCEERVQGQPVELPGERLPVAASAGSASSGPVTGAQARLTHAPVTASTVSPSAGAHPRIGSGRTVIELLVTGDQRWLERVASHVAETVGRPAPEVFAQVRELVDALTATAGSHGHVTVDATNEFWSRLTADESRDVLAALGRLGFQVEPSEGWHAARAPIQSDLSMALAYAGLDARSLRRLPSDAELRELPRSIGVDARALLMDEAPDLALDQVVRMLGHRADPLGPLWDDWGYVRPILLADLATVP
jgi:hypothetical protein